MARVKPVAFISSTREDLDLYRSPARDVALMAGFDPVMMEYFAAQGQNPPYEACMKRCGDADLVVAIVAHRYGWIPPDQPGPAGQRDKSITWLECEQAHSSGKEVLAFIIDEKHRWPFEMRETYRLTEAIEQGRYTAEFANEVNRAVVRIRDFKQWLSSLGFRATFADPEQFKAALLASLYDWFKRHPAFQSAQSAPYEVLLDQPGQTTAQHPMSAWIFNHLAGLALLNEYRYCDNDALRRELNFLLGI